MATIQANFSFLPLHQTSQSVLDSRVGVHSLRSNFNFAGGNLNLRKFRFSTRSSGERQEDYLIDAPVSIGDGFSFSGGKFSDGPNRSDEWFKQGKIVVDVHSRLAMKLG